MNKVLVPVDFSDTSLNALLYAIELFGPSSVEVTILHIYGIKSTALLMKSIDGLLEKDAQRSMDDLIKKIHEKYPDIIMKTKIVLNDAVPAITTLGNSGKYDVIVMGTKGASGLKEVFIGSVAGGVISKTKIPVVVVPTYYYYRPLKNIAFAISNTPLSSAMVIEPLRKIALMHKSKIEVLHVAKHQTADVKDSLQYLEGIKQSVTYIYGQGDINKALTKHLMESDADLLCLIRSKKGFFDALFGESVTLKQTFSSTIPLLILHD